MATRVPGTGDLDVIRAHERVLEHMLSFDESLIGVGRSYTRMTEEERAEFRAVVRDRNALHSWVRRTIPEVYQVYLDIKREQNERATRSEPRVVNEPEISTDVGPMRHFTSGVVAYDMFTWPRQGGIGVYEAMLTAAVARVMEIRPNSENEAVLRRPFRVPREAS